MNQCLITTFIFKCLTYFTSPGAALETPSSILKQNNCSTFKFYFLYFVNQFESWSLLPSGSNWPHIDCESSSKLDRNVQHQHSRNGIVRAFAFRHNYFLSHWTCLFSGNCKKTAQLKWVTKQHTEFKLPKIYKVILLGF